MPSYWAEIDGSNLVTNVMVSESAPASGTWVQTYKDRSQRKNYAGIGYTWDSGRNAFIAPKPYPSWALNESTCRWEAPVTYPDDGNRYLWDENNTRWVANPLE